MYKHTYIHTYIIHIYSAYLHTYIPIYIYTCMLYIIHIHVCKKQRQKFIRMYTHTYAYIHRPINIHKYSFKQIRTHTYIHTHMYVCSYIDTDTQTCIQTYRHKDIEMHTQSNKRVGVLPVLSRNPVPISPTEVTYPSPSIR